jgi:hypothetical protein
VRPTLPSALSGPSRWKALAGQRSHRRPLNGNAFIERVLPGSIKRALSDDEMTAYRAPFPTPESRRPILRPPNDLPIAGEPVDVHDTLEAAHVALAASEYPNVLCVGDPGALISPAFADRFAAGLTNCKVVNLVRAPTSSAGGPPRGNWTGSGRTHRQFRVPLDSWNCRLRRTQSLMHLTVEAP